MSVDVSTALANMQAISTPNSVRGYYCFPLPETLNTETIMSPGISIYEEVVTRLKDDLNVSDLTIAMRLLMPSIWEFFFFHPDNPKFIPTYEEHKPGRKKIIPRETICVIFDLRHNYLFVHSDKEDLSHVLTSLVPFFNLPSKLSAYHQLSQLRYLSPKFDFKIMDRGGIHWRRPTRTDLVRMILLKQIKFLEAGNTPNPTTKNFTEDGFEDHIVKEPLIWDRTHSVKLGITPLNSPSKPISMDIIPSSAAIRASISSKTIDILAYVLKSLENGYLRGKQNEAR